jgi:hypothetical protein
MNGSKDMIQLYLYMTPGRSYPVADLSARLHIPPRQIEGALRDLRDCGIVEIDDQGNYRRLIKAHVRQPGERPPCRGGRQWKLEHKREQEQREQDQDAAEGGILVEQTGDGSE